MHFGFLNEAADSANSVMWVAGRRRWDDDRFEDACVDGVPTLRESHMSRREKSSGGREILSQMLFDSDGGSVSVDIGLGVVLP